DLQDQNDEFYLSICFGVLSVLTAGGLAWLGGLVQKSVTNKMRDMLYAGLDEKFSSALFKGAEQTVRQTGTQAVAVIARVTRPRPHPVSSNPQVFQNDVLQLLDLDEQTVRLKFKEWKDDLLRLPLGIFDNPGVVDLYKREAGRWINEANEHIKGNATSLPS